MALISATALVVTIVSSVSISLYVQYRARQRDLHYQIQQMGREFDEEYGGALGNIISKKRRLAYIKSEEPGDFSASPVPTDSFLDEPLFSAGEYAWAIWHIQLRPGGLEKTVSENAITTWVKAAQVLQHLRPYIVNGQPEYSVHKKTLELTEDEVATLSDISSFILDRRYVLDEYGVSPLQYTQIAGHVGVVGFFGIVVPIGVLLTPSLTEGHTITSPGWVALVLLGNVITWFCLFKSLYHQFVD